MPSQQSRRRDSPGHDQAATYGVPVPNVAFRDRPLSPDEFEVLRLVLSTFRDGSGQVPVAGKGTMPGFRDFERSLAAVLKGSAPENKGILDVIVPVTDGKPFGISCKMTAWQPLANESSFMELSNSAAKFRNHLLSLQINWVTEPMLAGPAVVDLVSTWHTALADEADIERSLYGVLAHDRLWNHFRLDCFPLDLKIANPVGGVEWSITRSTDGKANSLRGHIDLNGRPHCLWQFYPNSGGQLKYFPPFAWAKWISDPFVLEIPATSSLLKRAQLTFPDLWPATW